MERILEFICGHDEISLEGFLRKKGISRRTVISMKRVPMGMTRNGVLCRTVDILHKGDRVCLRIPESERSENAVYSGPTVGVVYEDEDIILFDKPYGVPVHRSCGHYGDTLQDAFAVRFPDRPFRAVNRLDRDTSGLCLAAKSRLGANIPRENIGKVYFAVCCGEVKSPMVIDKPIGRVDGSAVKRCVCDGGKPSVTRVFPLEGNGRYTLLRIILETGRTHQIRVHMSCSGFPLAGDSLYGGDMTDISRQALHCGEMEFIHPVSGERLWFRAEIPTDIRKCVIRNS